VNRGLVVLVAVATTGLIAPLIAESQELGRRLGGANGPPAAEATPNKPAPRLPDGKIDLSGVWTDGGGQTLDQILKPAELDQILLPHTKKLMQSRNDGQDPYNYCLPGGPLRITGGFAWRFIQHPTTNSTHIFMLQEGNAHTYRQIFMDGRKHPEYLDPTWYGHSIGWWEKDTLVIDTVGFNDKAWFDGRGTPHTEQLHTIERWTRLDLGRLENKATIDDPGAYSKPFEVTINATTTIGDEVMEYICQDGNQYGINTLPTPAK
jgi:hypothetical protein